LAALQNHWLTNGQINPELTIPEIRLNQKIKLASSCQLLGLQPNDLLATCIYAYLSPQGGVIHIQGDGVVALKFKNQNILMYRYEWQDNRPYYPAYAENRLIDFIAAHGNDLQAIRLKAETWQSINNQQLLLQTSELTLGQGLQGICLNIDKNDLDQELEYIAVFSDGVTQIDNVKWQDAVIDFLNFKNTKGEFAKRRMIRGISEMIKLNKGPLDDIAYAVIRLDQPKEVPDAA
ncbi:MAG: hypothetical protein NT116_00460, partial [Candidatus Parcubacteria bacterium]|nr:hypothetical protein [Candidatus Parcubacteria bacterium]